jgi:hypothetical protein
MIPTWLHCPPACIVHRLLVAAFFGNRSSNASGQSVFAQSLTERDGLPSIATRRVEENREITPRQRRKEFAQAPPGVEVNDAFGSNPIAASGSTGIRPPFRDEKDHRLSLHPGIEELSRAARGSSPRRRRPIGHSENHQGDTGEKYADKDCHGEPQRRSDLRTNH